MDEQPVPDEKDDERTDRRTDESGALIEPVPTDGLAEESGQEGARNAKHRGQDEACRVVRPRREEPCDETGDEADHDHPNDVPHRNLRIECATSWLAVQRSELRRIERVAAPEPSRFQARHDSARALSGCAVHDEIRHEAALGLGAAAKSSSLELIAWRRTAPRRGARHTADAPASIAVRVGAISVRTARSAPSAPTPAVVAGVAVGIGVVIIGPSPIPAQARSQPDREEAAMAEATAKEPITASEGETRAAGKRNVARPEGHGTEARTDACTEARTDTSAEARSD